MVKRFCILASVLAVSACNPAYVPQSLPGNAVRTAAENQPVEFSLSLKPLTSATIAEANASHWDRRLVEISASDPSGTRVLRESDLQRGPALPANEMPAYTLGRGDVVSLALEIKSQRPEIAATNIIRLPVLSDGTIFDAVIGRVDAEGRTLSEIRSEVAERLEKDVLAFPPRSERNLPPANVRPTYHIGAGDLLALTAIVPEMTDTGAVRDALKTRQFVVSSSGNVNLIGAGEVFVEGLTTEQAVQSISIALLRAGQSPDVELAVVQNNSNPVQVVFGAGQNLPIIENLFSLSELATASGLQVGTDLDFGIKLERGGETYEILLSELRAGLAGGPVYLHPGDLVEIFSLSEPAEFSIDVEEFNSRRVMIGSPEVGGQILPILRDGLTLSAALVVMNVQVSSGMETLVTVYRGASVYRMRASDVLRSGLQTDYYLLDGDRISFQTITYQPDRIYITGAGTSPKIVEIQQIDRTSLTDAVYGSGAFSDENANLQQVFVLREKSQESAAFDAYFLDLSNPTRLSLANDFQMRPDDIVFVSDQPSAEFAATLGKLNGSISAGLTGLGLVNQIFGLFN